MQTTRKSFFNKRKNGIIKSLTVLAILFSISVFVFGAGINENQSSEILITENDRMTVDFDSFDIKTLIFKGYDYKKQVFQSVYKIDYKYTELGKLFMLVGLKAVRSYELYLNKYRNEEPASTDFNEINRYAKQLNQLLIETVKYFNEYIASSQENRKKIAAILQERYNFEQQSNQAEQRIEQNSDESIQNYQGKGSILLGLNLEANLFTSSVGYPGSPYFGAAVSIGTSFVWFFGSPLKKHDIGFMLNIAFRLEIEYGHQFNDIDFIQRYLDLEPLIVFKFRLNNIHNILFAFGPELKLLLSSSNDDSSNKSVFGLSIKIGHFRYIQNSKCALLSNVSIKIMKKRSSYFSGSESGQTDFYFGGSFAFLFNLN